MPQIRSRTLAGLLLVAAVLGVGGALAASSRKPSSRPSRSENHAMSATTVHSFQLERIDGTTQSLADYKGRTLLIVNTASRCGFTPQYEALEAVRQKYMARGFEVLAFPANDFMGQEPGSNAEIQQFCSTRFHTTFPLFAKISVKGAHMAPLYRYLTQDSAFPGDIGWNFAKFLVGPDGQVVARFGPSTAPDAREVTQAIERSLAATPER